MLKDHLGVVPDFRCDIITMQAIMKWICASVSGVSLHEDPRLIKSPIIILLELVSP